MHDPNRVVPRIQSEKLLKPAADLVAHWMRCCRNEARLPGNLSLRQRVKAWRHGFSSDMWSLYRLQDRDPRDYLPDLSSELKVRNINGSYSSVVGEKLILSEILEAHGIPQPVVVATVFNGLLFGKGLGIDMNQKKVLSRTLELYPRQIFRPTWSGGGAGVFLLERVDDVLKLNGRKATSEEVHDLISGLDRYMSTAYVEQSDYAQAIFPGTVNTIRVLTLWDETEGPFIASISHRFGSHRSGVVDNFHKGHQGLCAAIDLVSSRLGKAANRDRAGNVVFHTHHPDTGSKIEGIEVAGLPHCLEQILLAAQYFPYCPCMGWDIAMTRSGYLVIEINPFPGMAVWQVHQPLLSNPKIRRFFERHAVIRPGR